MKMKGKTQNMPVEVSFTITKGYADALNYMADEDFRSRDEELTWLIEKERAKRTAWGRHEHDTQATALLRAEFALQSIMRMAADKVDHEQIYKTAAFGLGRDTAEGDAENLPVAAQDDRK